MRSQFALHQAAGLRVERPERLVHQQDARVDRQRAGDRGALLHAAGQLRRVAVLKPGETDQIDEIAVPATSGCRAAGPAFQDRRERFASPSSTGTARNAETRCRGRGRARRPAGPRPGSAPDSTGKNPPTRYNSVLLPQPLGPSRRDELAVAHRERHVVERQHRTAARRPVHVADPVDQNVCRVAHRAPPCSGDIVSRSNVETNANYRAAGAKAQGSGHHFPSMRALASSISDRSTYFGARSTCFGTTWSSTLSSTSFCASAISGFASGER